MKLENPALYEASIAVLPKEWPQLPAWEQDLLDTLLWYQMAYGAGRAIAAPQIGIPRRMILLCIDVPILLVNPSFTFPDDEMMEVLDDCMSFPGLCVAVLRDRRVLVDYTDRARQAQQMALEAEWTPSASPAEPPFARKAKGGSAGHSASLLPFFAFPQPK